MCGVIVYFEKIVELELEITIFFYFKINKSC